jgi:hypothetical protein
MLQENSKWVKKNSTHPSLDTQVFKRGLDWFVVTFADAKSLFSENLGFRPRSIAMKIIAFHIGWLQEMKRAVNLLLIRKVIKSE